MKNKNLLENLMQATRFELGFTGKKRMVLLIFRRVFKNLWAFMDIY